MIFQQEASLCCLYRKEECEGIPDGIAVLAGLAVQETQLLERLAENIFAAHFVVEDVEGEICVDGREKSEKLGQMNLSMAARVIRRVKSASRPHAATLRQKLPPERRRLSLKLQIANEPQPDAGAISTYPPPSH